MQRIERKSYSFARGFGLGSWEQKRGFIVIRTFAAVVIAVIFIAQTAFALEGRKVIYLTDANSRIAIADVEFSPTNEGATYVITMREDPFADHFLSMRPFKCLEGTTKHWCHVPYPYDIQRKVTESDLTDLEYDLLFVWKGANEYGINMWNGVYYQLEMADGRIAGTLNEIDMDTLSAPPEASNLRPIRDQDVEESDPEGHWWPFVVVE